MFYKGKQCNKPLKVTNWRSMRATYCEVAENAVDVGDGLLHDLGDVGEFPHLSEETKTGDFMY